MEPIPFQMDMINFEIIKPKYHEYFRFINYATKRIELNSLPEDELISMRIIYRVFKAWKDENDKKELKVGHLHECMCMIYGFPEDRTHDRVWRNVGLKI